MGNGRSCYGGFVGLNGFVGWKEESTLIGGSWEVEGGRWKVGDKVRKARNRRWWVREIRRVVKPIERGATGSRIIQSSGGCVVVALGPQLGRNLIPILLGEGDTVQDRHEQIKMCLFVPSGTVRHDVCRALSMLMTCCGGGVLLLVPLLIGGNRRVGST